MALAATKLEKKQQEARKLKELERMAAGEETEDEEEGEGEEEEGGEGEEEEGGEEEEDDDAMNEEE